MLSILRVQPQRCHQCQVHDWHQCRSKHPGSTARLGSDVFQSLVPVRALHFGMWEKMKMAVSFKCKIVLQLYAKKL